MVHRYRRYRAEHNIDATQLTVGTVLRACELGRKGHGKFIYAPCERCGEPRLVAYYPLRGTPVHKYCRSCAYVVISEKLRSHPAYNGVLLRNGRDLADVLADPREGDLVHGPDIGKSGSSSSGLVYVWRVCPVCGGNARWVINHAQWRDRGCRSCADAAMREKIQKYVRKKKNRWGYILVFVRPSDPYFALVPLGGRARKGNGVGGYVQEHRLVMAKSLGRCLEPWEQVHHMNGNKTDNRIENLELVTPSKHSANSALQAEVYKLRRRVLELERELAGVLSCPAWSCGSG